MTSQQLSDQGGIRDADYIDSIQDPFFRSVAQQTVGLDADGGPESTSNSSDAEKEASARDRLEKLEIEIRKKLLELLPYWKSTHTYSAF